MTGPKNHSTPSALFARAPPDTSQNINPVDEVLLAIRQVLAGEIYLSEKMTSVFLESLTTAEFKTISEPVDQFN